MDKPVSVVVLMLGGNVGDTRKIFSGVINMIDQHVGDITLQSSLYSSSPWGFSSQPDFLNQALIVETSLNPGEVLVKTSVIEEKAGKNKTEKNGPRVIDIDILFYDGLVINTGELIIPHPRLHLRRFNLLPLNEIIPDFQHPLLHKNISSLLSQCDDTLTVNRIQVWE